MPRDERNLPEEVQQASHEHYRNFFDTHSDRSGLIPLRELREILRSDGEVPRKIVRKVFNMYDSNRDGKIDYHEFIGMIQDKNFEENLVRYVNIYIRFIMPHRYLPILSTDGATKYEETGLYEEQYSCSPPAVAMLIISVFEFICFLIDEMTKQDSTKNGVTANIFIYDPYKRFECWRYLTYTFVHVGYLHLVVNLGVQLLLGVPLEMVHKWWRVLLVYFTGIVAASLAASITNPTLCLAGASGGVYALITAHVVTIIMNWKLMSCPAILLIIFIFLTSADFGWTFYNKFWLASDNNISYSAHFAGAITGLLVGTWILKRFLPTTTTKQKKYISWFAFVIFIVSMGVMIALNIFWTRHFPSSKVG